MPLPKPPTKRADTLTAEAFSVKATPRGKTGSKPKAALPLDITEVETPNKPALALVKASEAATPAAVDTAPTKPRKTGAVKKATATATPIVADKQGTADRSPAPVAAAPSRAKPESPANTTRRSRRQDDGPPKIFVLDTNVLLHDPMSLFRFDEHDVYLPMITLEELDGHKKGMTEVARNARQVSRDLDALAADMSNRKQADPSEGIALAKTGHVEAAGKLYFQTKGMEVTLPMGLPQGKADNQILGVVQALRDLYQDVRDVVLVSKDINMRIKARALGLPAEDYFNDKTLDDGDLLYTGVMALPGDFWERHAKGMESWQQGGVTYYRVAGPLVASFLVNQFIYLESPGATPWYGKVTEITGKTAVLRTLKDYTHQKNSVWGVAARNREQNFALNLLMDPECDFVTLTGSAGTGKTLMTLAAALSQVLDERRYTETIVTRVTVPASCPAPKKKRCRPGWARWMTTSKCWPAATTRLASGAAPPPTSWYAARSRSRA
jgi:PhoH-like ATPase